MRMAELFEKRGRCRIYCLNTQLADGSWNIGWSWGGNYPDEWAISKNWWKGQWIIQNLLYLKGFGRL